MPKATSMGGHYVPTLYYLTGHKAHCGSHLTDDQTLKLALVQHLWVWGDVEQSALAAQSKMQYLSK